MYLLDSNVFIEAKNRYYGFGFCPAFWDWLDHAHADNLVFSVDKVREELAEGADQLSDWVTKRSSMFLPTDDAVLPSLRALSEWANQQKQLKPGAVNSFLQVADYFLVGHAHTRAFVVVTHERAGTGSQKQVKIPDACDALGVKWMSPFEMLRQERPSFVLAGVATLEDEDHDSVEDADG